MSNSAKIQTNSLTQINIIKLLLTGILLFLPFQRKITKDLLMSSSNMTGIINSVDEITIVVFFLLAFREYCKNRKLPDCMYVFTSIFLMGVVIFISGIVNGNFIYTTILGTFDYIKMFLVIFIYAAFFKEKDDFKKIFRLLLILASIIGAVALLQELWALSARYLLGRDLHEMGGYLIGRNEIKEISWRFGIYRPRSLMHNSNIMGLYCLLIFITYIFTEKKKNLPILFLLLIGVLTSLSRMAYAGIALSTVIYLFRQRNRLIIIGGTAVLTLFLYMGFVKDVNFLDMLSEPDSIDIELVQMDENGESLEEDNEVEFREYTKNKAMEIWKDHPVWGVGPGMFGGRISLITHSEIYEEYNIFKREQLGKWGGIDQFWSQLLAELGIVGTVHFILLLLSLYISFLIVHKQSSSDEMQNLSKGLGIFIIVILIICTGSGINIAPVIFTYMAFIGILYGSYTT